MVGISFNIDNVLNVFSSKNILDILEDYNLDNYYELTQIHSNIINVVDNNYLNKTNGDALITMKLNTPLVIKTADCIPILIYDKENKVLSLVHSGWKGTLNNIVGDTVKYMINNYHSKKENIYVYLYPSIRMCHFLVDEDVYLLFKDKIKDINKYSIKKDNKYHIDLQGIVINNLHELGINNIEDSNICTYCNKEYHSYRRNHTDKRNYLIAMIKERE